MTWDEIAQAKKEILELRQSIAEAEGKTMTQREIAIELNEDPATFSRDIKVAEALEANPELKKSSSRKAALRGAEMIQHERTLESRISANLSDSTQLVNLRRNVRAADGRDYLRQLAPRSIDLIVTDPPFGIDYWKSGHKMVAGGPDASLGMSEYDDTWETAKDLMADIVPLWAKVIRETGWMMIFCGEELEALLRHLFVTCCAEHCDYFPGLRVGSDLTFAKRCKIAAEEQSQTLCRPFVPEPKPWIWYRPNSRNRSRYPERHAQNQYENILVVNAGRARLTRPCSNVLICDAEYGEDRIHANQKPVALIGELIERTTFYGDSVLDTFMGSGAHLAAAAGAGRFIYGCDSNDSIVGQAIGHIMKYFQPVADRGKEQSDNRYQYNRQNRKAVEEIMDFTEIEGDA
jgi:DNA modification methylase